MMHGLQTVFILNQYVLPCLLHYILTFDMSKINCVTGKSINPDQIRRSARRLWVYTVCADLLVQQSQYGNEPITLNPCK